MLSGLNILNLHDITDGTHTVYIAARGHGLTVSNMMIIAIPAVYTLTIIGGTIQGSEVIGTYADWAQVPIIANLAPDGYVFDKWTSDGNNNNFINPTSPAATFIMPAKDVTLTANWKQAVTPTVTATSDVTAPTTSTTASSSVSSPLPTTPPTTPSGDGIDNSHFNWGLWIVCPLFVAGIAALVCLIWNRKK